MPNLKSFLKRLGEKMTDSTLQNKFVAALLLVLWKSLGNEAERDFSKVSREYAEFMKETQSEGGPKNLSPVESLKETAHKARMIEAADRFVEQAEEMCREYRKCCEKS